VVLYALNPHTTTARRTKTIGAQIIPETPAAIDRLDVDSELLLMSLFLLQLNLKVHRIFVAVAINIIL
jgi:hypothetical protein